MSVHGHGRVFSGTGKGFKTRIIAWIRKDMHMRSLMQEYPGLIYKIVLIFGILCASYGLDACINDAYAQQPTIDSLMTPSNGEKAGELGRKEIFANALKRENLDNNSIRLAMQSINKLFNFRLSRSGDRYLYKAGPDRKLLLLRYQNMDHVYEAVYNPETGSYDARLVETVKGAPEQVPEVAENIDIPGSMDDDGEIDVEREALNQASGQPANDLENADSATILNDLDMADPDDPVQPVDPVLMGRVSPDEDFPDTPGDATDLVNEDEVPGPAQPQAKQPWREENFRETADVLDDSDDTPPNNDQQIQDENQLQNLPGTSAPVVQPSIPLRVKRAPEHDGATFSTISLVMFGLGSCMFVFALIAIVVPAVRLRRRCAKNGLVIRDMIQISPTQRIARLDVDGHECIVAIHPEKMSFIAPCPPDDKDLWQAIRSKTYWYQMSETPVSDRQLAGIIQAFYKKNDKPDPAHQTQNMHVAIVEQDEVDFEDEEYDNPDEEKEVERAHSGFFSESDINEDEFFSTK